MNRPRMRPEPPAIHVVGDRAPESIGGPWAGERFAVAALVLLLAAALMVVRLATGPSVPGRPFGLTGSWSYAWGDEFDRLPLNGAKWQAFRGGRDIGGDAPFNPDKEDAAFSSADATVRNGQLVLSVHPGPKRIDDRTYPFTSGVVQSRGQYVIHPGTYLEARIQVPTCDGCWPAFWAVPAAHWPPEVDTFEYFDTAVQSRPSFSYHAPNRDITASSSYGDPTLDYRQGFHVYGLLWDGSRVMPYLDGKPYPAAAVDSVPDEPLIVLLNLSVARGGKPPPGASMAVDWVRVWQK